MKSINENKNLWTNISVEELETREEYAKCFVWCFECVKDVCFTCVDLLG